MELKKNVEMEVHYEKTGYHPLFKYSRLLITIELSRSQYTMKYTDVSCIMIDAV